MIRAAGGEWYRKKGLWELPCKGIIALGRIDSVVTGAKNVQFRKKYDRYPPLKDVQYWQKTFIMSICRHFFLILDIWNWSKLTG